MSAAPKHADARFAAAIGDRRFGGQAPKLAAVAPPLPPPPVLRVGDIHLGDAEDGVPIGIDLAKLIDGRFLIQGVSGAGKSWTLRRLLEQTAAKIQQIVVDPEDEFGNFAKKFGFVHLAAHRLDGAALEAAASRAREHRISMVVDFSHLEREQKMTAIAAFVPALVNAPPQHWHPCLVAIDEAQVFAPYGASSEAPTVRKASIAALIDLVERGRKRGIASVLATLRLARLASSVKAEVLNLMIGLNTLDRDIRTAAEQIGWDVRRAFDRLPALEPGNFVAVGPAFSRSPAMLKVGTVETRHRGATPLLAAPPARDRAAAADLLELDALMAASAADESRRAESARPLGLRAIRAFIREDAFADAGRLWGTLQKLAPDGALLADLARHLNRKPDAIAAALALLDQYGAVEFSGDGAKRAARIAEDML